MPTRVQVKGPLLLSSFAFEMQSLIEHGVHHFSSTGWTVSSWNLAISMPQCWGYRYTPLRPVFDVGAGDPHSAHHACAVSSLPIPVSFGSIHLSFPVLLWCGLWLLKVTSSAILAVEPTGHGEMLGGRHTKRPLVIHLKTKVNDSEYTSLLRRRSPMS